MSVLETFQSAVDALVLGRVGAGEAESGVRAGRRRSPRWRRSGRPARPRTDGGVRRPHQRSSTLQPGPGRPSRPGDAGARSVGGTGRRLGPRLCGRAAELASAACSLGEPSLSVWAPLGDRRRANRRPTRPAVRFGASGPHTPTDGQSGWRQPDRRRPSAPEPEAAPAKTLDELLAELDALSAGRRQDRGSPPGRGAARRVPAPGQAAARPAITRHLVFVGNPGHRQDHRRPTVAALPGIGGASWRRASSSSPTARASSPDTSARRAEDRRGVHQAIGGALFIDERTPGDDSSVTRRSRRSSSKWRITRRALVIVAGYPGPMEGFIDANPGLASRFG